MQRNLILLALGMGRCAYRPIEIFGKRMTFPRVRLEQNQAVQRRWNRIAVVTGNCTYQRLVSAGVVTFTIIWVPRLGNGVKREIVTCWRWRLWLRYGETER